MISPDLTRSRSPSQELFWLTHSDSEIRLSAMRSLGYARCEELATTAWEVDPLWAVSILKRLSHQSLVAFGHCTPAESRRAVRRACDWVQTIPRDTQGTPPHRGAKQNEPASSSPHAFTPPLKDSCPIAQQASVFRTAA